MKPKPTTEAEKDHMQLYFRELRKDRLIKQYLTGMHSMEYFEHSSIGIALSKQISQL